MDADKTRTIKDMVLLLVTFTGILFLFTMLSHWGATYAVPIGMFFVWVVGVGVWYRYFWFYYYVGCE